MTNPLLRKFGIVITDSDGEDVVILDDMKFKKCENCSNPMQIPETGLCAPCTFGEAESLWDFDFILVEDFEGLLS